MLIAYSFFAVSDVPTSNELDIQLVTEEEIVTLLELIHTISSKWEIIGSLLGFAPSELEKIRKKTSLFMKPPKSFLKELLSQWVQWPTARHRSKPTLRALCTSLRTFFLKLGSLADKVEMEMKQSLTSKE